MLQRLMKPISFLLIFSFLLLDFSVQQAKADLIDTNAAIAVARQENARSRLNALLDRQEVRRAMEEQGISVEEARQRVASLSDAEVKQVAQAMDQLPAGGDGLGVIVGAALFVFLVLLVTDIAGFTDVFSFVNHRR